MKTFLVEYNNIDDAANAPSLSEIVKACSKYDAKRVIKRLHPYIVIRRITPYTNPV